MGGGSREGRGRTIMEVGADGVALITIVHPPVNALSFDVLDSLSYNYEKALGRNDVKAIVISGANGKFSGGFDITGFGKSQATKHKPNSYSVDFLSDILEGAKKPSVAAVDGLALGGGLELAMACHARISTSSAQFGLPELQLGIIPGLGGTQRLPRLIGLSKSLEMMLTSKAIKGEEAHSLGLVDAIVLPDELIKTARKWALDILEHRKPWVLSLYKTSKLQPLKEITEMCKFARNQVQKRTPNIKHPVVCIDVIEEGIVSGPRVGLWKEAEAAIELQKSNMSKSLVHIFFAKRATSKIPGITDTVMMPRKVNKVAVVGGGLMGSGIATSLILNDFPVILKEVNEKFLQAGIKRVKDNLQSQMAKGKISPKKFEKAVSLLKGVLSYESFEEVDLVIEAVSENIALKQQIFADLEKYCGSSCIFASNTSTIDLTLIGAKTWCHDRIVGAHFFSPAHVQPLLEIIRTQETSAQVILDLISVAKKIKKTSILVGNCTGFATTRMLFPYMHAAMMLVDHGAHPYKIDRACVNFGMPMGPFRLSDLVGFVVSRATAIQFVNEFPDRTYCSMLTSIMLEDKRAGESTRKGFYLYDENRKASPDPKLNEYIEKARSISGVTVDPKIQNLSEKDMIEMLFFPVVNEACRILAEGIAIKASDLDIAFVLGMGFPPYRGGIVFWADSVGPKYICSRLEEWSKIYGSFFKPCDYLARRASQGIPLSSQAKPRL